MRGLRPISRQTRLRSTVDLGRLAQNEEGRVMLGNIDVEDWPACLLYFPLVGSPSQKPSQPEDGL